MHRETVRATAFAMPLTSPAFPTGALPVFIDREYFIIQYRTNPDALRRVVPDPLALTEPVVNYEFIRMPNSTGFGAGSGLTCSTVEFFCSDAASQITGTAISIDGGWTAQ